MVTSGAFFAFLGISASSLVTAFLNAITHWLEEGSAAIVSGGSQPQEELFELTPA